MSAEIRNRGDADIPEFLDKQGKELFPTADVARILDLPTLVKPELTDPASTGAEFQEDVVNAGEKLQRTHTHADTLRIHDGYWLSGQLILARGVKKILAIGDGTFPLIFDDFKRAVPALAPAEFAHYEEAASKGSGVSDDTFIEAGNMEQPSRIEKILGNAPRLHENTEENLALLREIAEAQSSLLLLEGYKETAGVLDLCLAFGDRKHVEAAIQLADRLRQVTCDASLGFHERVVEQGAVIAGIGELSQALSYKQLDEDTLQRVETRIEQLRSDEWRRLALDRIAALVTYGRAFRLRGNRHPELVEPIMTETPDPVPVSQPKVETPESEPRPDHLGEHRAKLEEVIHSANFKQFELLGTKEIKRRGLDKARGVLVRGESDGDGNLIVGGRSKTEAQRYVSVVEFLRSFITDASNIAEAKDMLEAAVDASEAYEKRLQEATTEASEVLTSKELRVLRASIPDVAALNELVAYIRDDWETASFVIGEYWPGNYSRATAEQLRQLLLLSKEEIQETATAEPEIQTEAEPEPEQEEPSELVEDEEVIIEKIEMQSALEAIAQQLDEVILPSKATREDVKRVVEASGITEEQAAQIDWERLLNLATLRELTGGTMYRSKEGDLGNAPPYFVIAIEFQGTIYAVAESPVEGNATYVIAEKDCPGTWLEVLQLDKASAREVGARRVIHREGKTTKAHLAKIQDVLIDLATTE